MKDTVIKLFILFAVIIYVISPLDIAPGPIDDIILVLMGIGSQKFLPKDD